MKITTPNTNFGFFGWRTSVELTEAQLAYFASLGVLQYMQRSPASNAEKILGKFEKRPENFKRSEIPWNNENKAIFVREMSKSQEIGEDSDKFSFTPVTEAFYHDLGATAEPKYADEKKAVQKHIDAGDVSKWNIEKVGYEGRDLTVENVEFLKAVKAFKQKLWAAEGL
jgi:hypothetical protein